MAGLSFDYVKIKMSIERWADSVIRTGIWEGKDLHIDEIDSLDTIKRNEWIDASITVLNASYQLNIIDSLILFLHLDLEDSVLPQSLESVSLSWLKENVHQFTPPSIHFASSKYYKDFYEKELKNCVPDSSILEFLNGAQDINFFFRTYFDKDEQVYAREIYIFINIMRSLSIESHNPKSSL
ncbi:hypothetical protein [Flavitalea sp.]|nr:hypothetical protein [Flavitalea sp.]